MPDLPEFADVAFFPDFPRIDGAIARGILPQAGAAPPRPPRWRAPGLRWDDRAGLPPTRLIRLIRPIRLIGAIGAIGAVRAAPGGCRARRPDPAADAGGSIPGLHVVTSRGRAAGGQGSLSATAALLRSRPVEEAQRALGTLLLLPLMFAVGLELTIADFRRVAAAPRAVVGGTLGQILLLPAISWSLTTGLRFDPAVSVGAFMLAATPGAGLSNILASVARANVALSVTLTAVSSVLAGITLPLVTAFALSLHDQLGGAVRVPAELIALQLAVLLGLPIGGGMWIRAQRPELAARVVPWARGGVAAGVLALVGLGIAGGGSSLPEGPLFREAAVFSLLWTAAAALTGFALARALRLPPDDSFAIVIEFGARNLGITAAVAIGSLGRLDLALLPGVYAMVGFPIMMALAALRVRLSRS